MFQNYRIISREILHGRLCSDGDQAKVVSATNEDGVCDLAPGLKKLMIGKVRVKQGLRPGVVAFSLGHGH